MQRTIINAAEKITSADLTAIGSDAVAGLSSVAGDAMGWPHHWSSVTVSEGSATSVTLTPGRLWIGDAIYALDEEATVDLTPRLPLVVGDTVIVALLLRGALITDQAYRTVRIDADTGTVDYQPVDKTVRWTVTVVDQAGIAGPTPVKPTVAATECIVAWVKLAQTGIVGIEMHGDHRAVPVAEVVGRLVIVEGDLALVNARTASLATDIAALGAAQRTIPRPEIIRQMQRGIARISRRIDLPAEAVAYGYDPGLVTDMWDLTHADALFRIREGVRFPYAAIRDNQLALKTAGDPLLTLTNGLALPAWTDAVFLEVEGQDGTKDISSQVHTEVQAVENTISGTSISYGPTVNVCENAAEWAGVSAIHAGETFAVNGVTYVSAGETKNSNNTIANFDAEAWNTDPANEGHKNYAVNQLIVDTWTTTYTTYITKSYGVTGSVYAQTFLNSQVRILTAVGLYFTRVGTVGDLNLLLCEVSSTGVPRFTKVLAKATFAPSALALGWTKLAIPPTLIEAGKRYAWVTVTTGNHALATVAANKYANGSLFWCTDGVWAQGSTTEDFAMRLYGATFAATRTVIEFEGINLDSGMTELQLLYRGWAPDGTQLTWEIKPVGSTEWQTLAPATLLTGNQLAGLPAQVSLRATFVGTTELQPSLRLDVTARVAAMRPRSDFRAVSKAYALGVSSSTIVVTTTWDNYDATHHTAANKIITAAGTVVAASSTTTEIDDTKPSRRTLTSIFNLGSPTTSIRLRPEATTDNVVIVPFIQNIAFHAL